jgi:hypothetical protein
MHLILFALPGLVLSVEGHIIAIVPSRYTHDLDNGSGLHKEDI